MGGNAMVIVAGVNPIGTNCGLAKVMKMVRSDGEAAYLPGPIEIQSEPSFAVRGIFPCGWATNYPYALGASGGKARHPFIAMTWDQGDKECVHRHSVAIMA